MRRLSLRALARSSRLEIDRLLEITLSLMPRRIFCWKALREKSPFSVPWRARASPIASAPDMV